MCGASGPGYHNLAAPNDGHQFPKSQLTHRVEHVWAQITWLSTLTRPLLTLGMTPGQYHSVAFPDKLLGKIPMMSHLPVARGKASRVDDNSWLRNVRQSCLRPMPFFWCHPQSGTND